MKPLKSQKELIENISPVIILSGGYGSGKSTALALKALDSKSSLILDLNYYMIRKVQIPIFTEILFGTTYKLKLETSIIETPTSTIRLNYYDKINKTNGLHGFKLATICFDNFESIEEELAVKLFRIARIRSKQLIISVNPADLRQDSFVRKLKYPIITASLFDNPSHTARFY